jgi:hypothetical protein
MFRSAFYRDLGQVDQIGRTQFPKRLKRFCPSFDSRVNFLLEDSGGQSISMCRGRVEGRSREWREGGRRLAWEGSWATGGVQRAGVLLLL